MAKAPPHGGARSSPGSVTVRPRPDQLQAFLAFDLDQGRVDRGGEARIVELDREVVAVRLVGVLLPSGAELGIRCGEDAEVRALVGGVFDADQPSFDVQGQGADGAREAVLGQPSIVLLKRSIGICFVICWRTLRVSFSAIAAPQLERRADVWPLQRDQMRA